MRKKNNLKVRIINLESKYNNLLVSKLINGLIINGNKLLAKKIVYRILELIRIKFLVNPIFILTYVFDILKPIACLRIKKIGGSYYKIPFKISENKSISLVIKWIKLILLNKNKLSIIEYLFREFINVYNGTGILLLNKNKLYKDLLHNRAFFYL